MSAREDSGQADDAPAANAERQLGAYATEVLRWNAGMNLVSRVRPVERLELLLDQVKGAGRALEGQLGDLLPGIASGSCPFGYVDIGSGAGLPGVPWRILMEGWRQRPSATWLVEPRARRAWFLERTVRLLGLAACQVREARWGAGPPLVLAENGPAVWIASLMMLQMPEAELLAGARAALAGGCGEPTLLVARVRGPLGPHESPDSIAAGLGLPPPPRHRFVPFQGRHAAGTLILSLHGAPVPGA